MFYLNMNPPDCTLTTACFDLTPFHPKSRSLHDSIENMRDLLEIPCYLVIYTDVVCCPLIRAIRDPLHELTAYIVQPFETTPYFKFVDQVKTNRAKTWPTRDERTCSENHVLQISKQQFLTQTMDLNPFHTSRFGWIDANIGKNFSKIAEDFHPEMLLNCLRQASDKFHIQVLTAIDKKFLKMEHKPDYYQKYRWVVCGSFYTTGEIIGRKIATRMDDLFKEITAQGYGHGDEMLYLEILEEFFDDIDIAYGDYRQILNNYFYPTRNVKFIHDLVLLPYSQFGYHREAYACSRKILQGIESGVGCSPQLYFSVLFKQYLAGFYADRANARSLVNQVYRVCEGDPLVMAELNSNREFYEQQFQCALY